MVCYRGDINSPHGLTSFWHPVSDIALAVWPRGNTWLCVPRHLVLEHLLSTWTEFEGNECPDIWLSRLSRTIEWLQLKKVKANVRDRIYQIYMKGHARLATQRFKRSPSRVVFLWLEGGRLSLMVPERWQPVVGSKRMWLAGKILTSPLLPSSNLWNTRKELQNKTPIMFLHGGLQLFRRSSLTETPDKHVQCKHCAGAWNMSPIVLRSTTECSGI